MNCRNFLSFSAIWPNSKARQRPSSTSHHQYETMEPRALMCGTPVMATASALSSLQEPQITTVQGPDIASEPRVGRIVNGTVTNQYQSVGMIGDTSGFFCSGTLIGSRYVLTAAHCAEGVAQTAGRFNVGSQTYSTSRIFVHPNYNSNLIGSDNANDIAIYVLDRDVVGVTPSQIYRSTPTVGQLLTLVGFGGGGNGNTGHDGSFGTKRVGTTPIDRVSSKLIHWRFDNNTESNTAPGDSGGPAFVTVNGTQYVAGVTSGGDLESAGIGDNSYDTRVDAFASWIDSIVGTVATTPTVSITSADATAAETLTSQAANTASFTFFFFTRTGSLTSPLNVAISAGGTALSGADYTAIPATVTIPAGSASTTLVVRPVDDSLAEGTETVIVNLGQSSGYQLSGTNRTVTLSILDNEVQIWNNQFANRFTLTGAAVTASGTNVGATRENGEPNVLNLSGGKSVWWTWTAPANGTVTISTMGSNFDTTLGVYTGSAVNQLTLVRANDDQNSSAGIYTSRVSFPAVAGRQYQILVDGYQGEAGQVKLSIQQNAARNSGRLSEFSGNGSQHRSQGMRDSRFFARADHGMASRFHSMHSNQNRFGLSEESARRKSDKDGSVKREHSQTTFTTNRIASFQNKPSREINGGSRKERLFSMDAAFSKWSDVESLPVKANKSQRVKS